MKHKGDTKNTPPKGQPSTPKPQTPGAPGTPAPSTHKQ
jgi:hypothetical protein